MTQCATPLSEQCVGKLSPGECKYLLLKVELPEDLQLAVAYRLGGASYYCNVRHAHLLYAQRRTKVHKRFYVRDICKCDCTCTHLLRSVRYDLISARIDWDLIREFDRDFREFCFDELPRNHFFFSRRFSVTPIQGMSYPEPLCASIIRWKRMRTLMNFCIDTISLVCVCK